RSVARRVQRGDVAQPLHNRGANVKSACEEARLEEVQRKAVSTGNGTREAACWRAGILNVVGPAGIATCGENGYRHRDEYAHSRRAAERIRLNPRASRWPASLHAPAAPQ